MQLNSSQTLELTEYAWTTPFHQSGVNNLNRAEMNQNYPFSDSRTGFDMFHEGHISWEEIQSRGDLQQLCVEPWPLQV